MTFTQIILSILIMSAMTLVTRFLPFILFPPHKPTPHFVVYLGQVLPTAAIALLVVYSLKDVVVTRAPYALPEVIALILLGIVHKLFRNTLASISVGTIAFILLNHFMVIG